MKMVDRAKVHSVAGSHFTAAVLKQIYLDDVSGFEPTLPFWWHSALASVGTAQTAEQQHTHSKIPFLDQGLPRGTHSLKARRSALQ